MADNFNIPDEIRRLQDKNEKKVNYSTFWPVISALAVAFMAAFFYLLNRIDSQKDHDKIIQLENEIKYLQQKK